MSIPKIIKHDQNDCYIVEGFLGKGTFSRCYTLRNISSGKLVAGKCICKKTIRTNKVKVKIEDEIRIHKSLNHENIVQFIKFFDSAQFVYIILELCANRSLADLVKKIRVFVLSEAKHFMTQTVCAVQYLHSKSIVHRDLKLKNLFIDSQMRVKVGDFGLAAHIKGNEKQYTLCGTPNYIAPEVISKTGHSFEVDIWALGCVLYHLLVGLPPFHSKSTETTYHKILKCDYTMPNNISPSASTFIKETLQLDSCKRPDINELLNFDFLTIGHVLDNTGCNRISSSTADALHLDLESKQIKSSADIKFQTFCIDNSLRHLKRLMRHLKLMHKCHIINEDPPGTDEKYSQPVVWVNAWVDYSVTYGFAYRLNDNSIGVLFNDHSCMMHTPYSKSVHYLGTDGVYYNVNRLNRPSTDFVKKLQILTKFQQYMQTSLRSAYVAQPRGNEADRQVPILVHWLRFEDSVVMMLSNGICQVNFTDHHKLILCSETKTVTCILNEDDCTCKVNTFKFDTLKSLGCSKTLNNKLNATFYNIYKLYNCITKRLVK